MRKRPLGFGALAAVVLLFLLMVVRDYPYRDYEKFQGKAVTITGKIYKKETVSRLKGRVLVLYLKLLDGNGSEGTEIAVGPPGKNAICYLKSGQDEPEMGSTVKVKGKFSGFERASNPGQFDAYSYYRISGISYRLNQAIILAKSTKYNKIKETGYGLRGFLSDKLSESLPEQEASVMQTMLLGEKSGMNRELKALYQRNGIAHILAISGLHISLLGMGLYKLLRKCAVPMNGAAALAAILMIFYGMMTGFSASALRAIIMFSLQMISILVKRTYDMLTALAVAAILILAQQPLYLFHSGFVFSFGCVLGIALLLPALTEKIKHPLAKTVVGGMGMTVITFPIYLWFYYQFPVWSVALNLLVIPLMSLLMAAGLMLLALQILFPPAALPFILLIKGILGIYENACGLCDGLPGNLLTPGRPEKWQMILYLAFLLLLMVGKQKIKLPLRWGIAFAGMLILTLPAAKGLEITFLDVGQGDCIYIENAQGGSYLTDGGSSSLSSVGEYRIIPFLKFKGACRLKAVFVTHPDTDHCNGIKELIELSDRQGIVIENLVLPDVAESAKNKNYLELERLAKEARIPVSYISAGQKLSDGRLTLTCIHPSKAYVGETNEFSIVLKADYGNFSAMLTGDVEGAGEKQMIRFLKEQEIEPVRRVTVLKAAHHGSAGSTPEEFLECRMPLYTVISCGRGNSYGHPHKELLERLYACGTDILITYETGAVTFATDGKKLKLSKFLNE